MVSFTCNHCQDVVKKPKVVNHANSCGSHSFTCVDCMHVFDLDSIKAHTSCVTEEDKYQGKWKQKLGGAAQQGGAPPRGIERPPRAPMNDLSSSDSDDEDWVKTSTNGNGSSGAKAGKASRGASGSAAATAAKSRKHPRPGVSPSSDDDDDDVVHDAKAKGQHGTHTHHAAASSAKAVQPPAKKARTAGSASTTPKATPRSPPSSSLGPKMAKPGTRTSSTHDGHSAAAAAAAATRQAKKEEEEDGDVQALKKDTPLLLPRSTTSTECMVPSFVLGTSEEVAEIVRDVLAEHRATAMRSKDVAAALVERYAKRIAKSVRHAVDTAVELGALKVDKAGNVSVA